MQLTLTDREAELLECYLSGQMRVYSDTERLMLRGIADRLLAREVGSVLRGTSSPIIHWDDSAFMQLDKQHRKVRIVHHTTRQSDEYACSCGARWDVSEDHP